MSPKASEIAWGCGIGCAVLLVAGIIAGVGGGYVLVKRTTRGYEAAVETRARLDKQFGEPETFVPRPDGTIPPDRMDAFLKVRHATAPTRAAIVAFFSSLPMSKDAARELESKPAIDKLGAALRIGRSAFGFAQDLGGFFEARDRALLDAGMGMGEYIYIYAVSYYAWLGHSPTDGPGEGHDHDHERRSMAARVHDDVLRMLQNQLAAMERSEGPPADRRSPEALKAEIEAMKKDPQRAAWQDDLPTTLAASLDPFRSRLEATYSATTNPFELGRPRKSGKLSFTTD